MHARSPWLLGRVVPASGTHTRAGCGALWLRAIVTAVIVLNLLDAVLTLLWVQLGVATEANLLLAGILARSAVLFMVVKMSLVSLGIGLLWRQRTRPLAVFGIALVFCAYATLLVHHLHVAVVATGLVA